MHRYFLLITAGLCLAIIGLVSCGNEPVTPPVNTGATVVITDDGDGQLISREPIIISWDFVTIVDRYTIDYSTNDGETWSPIGETRKIASINWQIPSGTETSAFIIRVDGYSDRYTAPRSRSISPSIQVIPYGTLNFFDVDAESQISEGSSIYLDVTAKDRYDNTVLNFHDSGIIISGHVQIDGAGVPGVQIFIDDNSTMTDGSGAYFIIIPNSVVDPKSWVDGSIQLTTSFNYNSNIAGGIILYIVDGGGGVTGQDSTNIA
ncbi:MAG: hypothetical protein WC805_03205 [Patescibacteria group bacterium]|jgi:hypothetical protein